MEEYTLKFDDSQIESENLKALLLTFVEDNLNARKLQNLSNWIKDQNSATSAIDEQIHQLKEMKKAISTLSDLENVSLNLKINVPQKKTKAA